MRRIGPRSWLYFARQFVVGLVLVYVAVILSIGGTSAARWTLYGGWALWSFASYFLAWQIAVPGTKSRLAMFTDLAATNVAVTLLLAELSLQLWCTWSGGSLLVRANLDAHRLVPGRDYGDGLIGNNLGYPGPELPKQKTPGVLRVAALGDSFAVGPAVPFADNYLTRLTYELPYAEVANFGVSGAGPREYLEILQRDVWSVQPDVVLLSIFVGNDITESLPRPRSLDPRHHALYLLCERGWKLFKSRMEQPTYLESPSNRLAGPPLSEREFREVEARRLAICLADSSPSMEKKWRRALADLDAIVQACRNRGVHLMVVLIPDEFQVNDAVLEVALADKGWSKGQIDFDAPQRRLAQFFSARNVKCLDLLPAFREATNTYAPFDTHWNIVGNHLAAREIAAWLAKNVSN